MPLELQIIRAREFIRIGAQGRLDLLASYQVLVGLARACRLRGIDRAMLDTRDVQAELTPNDLAELVGAFREIGFTKHQRLAVLHRGDPHRRARTFALIGKLRGWKVQAFDCFEDAMAWLSKEEKKSEPQAGDAIPVRTRTQIELKAARPLLKR